ncbi:MAG: putative glycosyl transferase, partial [Marmoricola sp.]|nr:putative glycosyl transferase [Marmoricola sp.]
MTGPASTRLPRGFAVRLSHDTLVRGGGATLLGGSGGALLRLRPRARAVLDGDRVVVDGPDSAALARLLLDRGLADPV